MSERRVRKEPPVDIDMELFLVSIKSKAAADEVSLHSVAWTLSISTSTFTRIAYAVDGIAPDYRPNLRTYLALCWWMGVHPATFTVTPAGPLKYVSPPGVRIPASRSPEVAP